MAYFVIVFCCIAITSIAAAPASNEQLDKGGQRFKNSASITREQYKRYRKYGQYLETVPLWNSITVPIWTTATVNDVAVNTVEDNANKQQVELVSPANSSVSTIEISGITTGAETPSPAATPAVENTPFKPQRAGSMFARFIDDIFQIPITVLRNVAQLITSPFTQHRKNPEVLAPVS